MLPATTHKTKNMAGLNGVGAPAHEELKEITMETARKLREQYKDKEFIQMNEMSPRLVKHKKIGSK